MHFFSFLPYVLASLLVTVSANWMTKTKQAIETNRIIERFQEVSITTCSLKCKMNARCSSIGMMEDIGVGEVDDCYLITDAGSGAVNITENMMYVTQNVNLSKDKGPPVTSVSPVTTPTQARKPLKWAVGADRTKADIASGQHPAKNAIDGDTDTFAEVDTMNKVSEWYGRLAKLSTIEYITLHLPTHYEYSAHKKLLIQTSVNAHFNGPWRLCAYTDFVKETPIKVICDAKVTKAITVRIRHNDSMKLNEVEVYGSEV